MNTDTVVLQPGEVLAVRRWSETFEKSDAKKIVSLSWVSAPTGFSSTGLQMLFDDFGPSHAGLLYGAWHMLIKIAADGRPGERGRLCGSRGTPYSSAALSRMMMGIPVEIVDELISWSVPRSGWLEIVRVDSPDAAGVSGPASAAADGAADSPDGGDVAVLGDTAGVSLDQHAQDDQKILASDNIRQSHDYRTGPDRTKPNHFRPAGTHAREFSFPGFPAPDRQFANACSEAYKRAIGLRPGVRLVEKHRTACWRMAAWLSSIPVENQQTLLTELTRTIRESRPSAPERFVFALCRERDVNPENFPRRWDATQPPAVKCGVA